MKIIYVKPMTKVVSMVERESMLAGSEISNKYKLGADEIDGGDNEKKYEGGIEVYEGDDDEIWSL